MTDNTEIRARIKARSIEEGECLIWQGCLVSNCSPVLTYKNRSRLVRRLLWELLGMPENVGNAPVVASCGDKRCVADHHLALGKLGPKVGSLRTTAFKAKMAALKQADSKLSADDVEAIRMSVETQVEIAARFGMSKRTIRHIRDGHTWRNLTGPFAGLGARA